MTETPPQPRPRWLRFSLRGLLLLILAVAALLGWTMHKVREQGVAVAALKDLGCRIEYDVFRDRPPTTLIERLRKLLGASDNESRNVIKVVANYKHLKDDDLMHVQRLPHLQCLWLFKTKVTDAGLVHLQGLSELNELDLRETKVTDAGLLHLQQMTQLHEVELSNTLVTEAGAEQLQNSLPQARIGRW